MNKNIRSMASMSLSAALAMSMAVPAFAAGNASSLTDGKSENTIPVNISADATTFDVTVPTVFPGTVDPDTGEVTPADNATISNNSYGAIKVSEIKVANVDDWNLAAYDTDMSKVQVDSNKIGIQVSPTGGAQGAGVTGAALKTTDASATLQTLLTASSPTANQWIINGKDATDGTNELTLKYATNASAVSQKITNKTVANIIVTVAWNA